MKKLLILLSFITLSAFAMQTQKSSIKPKYLMDLLPAEIRKEVFSYLVTEGSFPENIKKFYASSSFMQKNAIYSKELFSTMIERNILNYSELQTLIKALSKYKAFKNPELTRLIKKEITRLAESEKDDGTPRIALCSIL